MANEKLQSAGKNGLPILIASILCGYATNLIPNYFPIGDTRDWAYRSIPFLSLCILFIIKVISDIGSMTVGEILFLKVCASPEKEKLKKIINDENAYPDVREKARTRYNEILSNEIEINSRKLNYFVGWFKKPSSPPEIPTSSQED
ncbi:MULTISPECIES: hypothetical protein [Yersinia]|uniref:hypothetical protein n=1 Tax=Yersinia TaxID=629 RepID=UPI0005E955FB|nr:MULTISPECIES: hypothetical protein [Yersinia]CNJ78975.1 Uncharacterised protein [Yersinia intermedia]CRY10927.1 Uncharacterised protein [Yersinia enterocolitica]HEC1649078.1 hypothetical protein [Yersinia enterocolitica]